MNSSNPLQKLSLVGDIGGTNTRLALASSAGLTRNSIRKFKNADFENFESVVALFLKDQGDVAIIGVAIAVAGPVKDNIASMTNLDWTIDGTAIQHLTSASKVVVLNDLQAQGHALGHVSDEHIRSLIKRPAAAPETTMLVIGVGTGFNAAPVFTTPSGRLVTPSESGHTTLPIRTSQEARLASFIAKSRSFVAVEDVLSGRGLEQIYAWLTSEAGCEINKPAAEIAGGFKKGNDPLAIKSAEIFARFLGRVAGDLALNFLPLGGLYLVGGVARSLAPHLSDFGFEQAFSDKGRFSQIVSKISVGVIEDDYAALTGCSQILSEN